MNDKIKRRVFLLASFAGLPALTFAGDHIFGRRLRRRCALPCYNYETDRNVNPASANSTRAIAYLIDGSLAVSAVADPAESRTVLKTFQMDQSELRIDHCQISRVVVTISSDGHWSMNLTAQQNPALIEDPVLRPQFERFRRNRFRVDVRPVGLMPVNPDVDLAKVAKPEFPFIAAQDFWVQKGQLLRISRRGHSQELARHFNVIRQSEIHFSYSPLQTVVRPERAETTIR